MLRAARSPLFFALGVLALLLVAMERWRPGFFLHDDNATWFAGAYALDFRTLTQTGRIAEVNFFQYGGEPFVEQGQSGVLYPPVSVAAALAQFVTGDLRWTVEWLAALHLALALAGFYFWMRRAGMEAWLAAPGGLVWALNPFVLILGASWIFVTYVVAGLPWLFWAVDFALEGSLRRAGAGEALEASAAEGELVRGPSTAVGSASTSKGNVSPPFAQDDDLLKSGLRRGGLERELPLRGIPLGVVAGLFVLQGYVQWAAYAFLFAGMYGAYLLFVRGTDGQEPVLPTEKRTQPSMAQGLRRLPWALANLGVAGLIALALALPLVLPMVHAVAESKVRAQPLSIMQELFYRVESWDLLGAQVGIFRQHFLFDASTALFFCPALVLFPVAIMAFARGDVEVRRRLFPLMVLAVVALVLSSWGYLLLNVLPLMQRFRWPFKVFVFAEFFLVAALVWGVAELRWRRFVEPVSSSAAEGDIVRGPSTAVGLPSTGKDNVSPPFAQDDDLLKSGLRRGERKDESDPRLRISPSPAQGLRGLPLIVLAVVIVLQVSVAVGEHDSNFLSQADLPESSAGLPTGMDLARGRVISVDDAVPVADGARFFTHAYGTWFQVPSLGGYNPLVSAARLEFGMGLDVPNVFHGPITPEMRAALQDRAVRYWVVRTDSPLRGEIEAMAGMRILTGGNSGYISGAERTIYEDMGAKPIAFVGLDAARSPLGLPVRYAGNSMLIQLNGVAGTAAISAGPTDGWWARVDDGAWERPEYRGWRLYMPVTEKGRELEVRYFDPRLRQGFYYSLLIIGLLAVIAGVWRLAFGGVEEGA